MSAESSIAISGRQRRNLVTSVIILVLLFALAGWRLLSGTSSRLNESSLSPEISTTLSSSCALALAPRSGSQAVDEEIARLQQEAKRASDPSRTLEQLGWLYVSKARLSYDPGYFKLAEQCALCMEPRNPGAAGALLLRGHALHSLHRFQEAEVIARELVAKRGIPFDYGLLGDVMADRGHIREAVDAYQKMVDLRPDLQSYARAAHMRWLTGNVEGAVELMRMAARSGSPRDPESAAWAYSRLALYELQMGDVGKALDACDVALSFQNDYAPALLARGRVFLSQSKNAEAIELLRRAANLNPLPEYQWTLADALLTVGSVEEAHAVEAQLLQRGAANDPRTFVLYLATRGEQIETALRLAQQELAVRGDVFTHDAFAWALAKSGRVEEARVEMERALAEGTKDARLFLHAGLIAEMTGRRQEARRRLKKAYAMRWMLLPSEREQLSRHLARI